MNLGYQAEIPMALERSEGVRSLCSLTRSVLFEQNDK